MYTIALRYSDNFAPKDGTIACHQRLIDENGFVWYGKIGTPLSDKVINNLMSNKNPKVLLIKSGGADRHWAYIESIVKNAPIKGYPDYYKEKAAAMKCWLKIIKIEKADRKVMSECVVISSGQLLSGVSKHSMSPYFIIEYKGEV